MRTYRQMTEAVLIAACLAALCSPAFGADIYFTYVPPYGSQDDLSGQTWGVLPNDYKVLTYIFVSGWWNKPTWANPLTSIASDCGWTCDITTGGISDTYATRIVSFLVPNGSYQPSWQMSGQSDLPSELWAYPHADVPRTPADRSIRFASQNWAVKTGQGVGPGPNNFADSAANVWVDANGWLHLKITNNDGQWYCSEIISDESFGYGTYIFTVASRVDWLDKNIVLGLFTWDSYAPQYHYREIDFEFSRWQDPANENSQYVIQPWDAVGNMSRFNIDYAGPGSTTTHVMTWRPEGIYFKSFYGDFTLAPSPADLINEWSYAGADTPPAGGENVRMNLWLIMGLAPSNGAEAEITITDFQFLAGVSDQPGDINDDGRVNLQDVAQIAAHWQDDNCSIYNRWCDEADATCDGQVNFNDIAAFVHYWLAAM